MDVPPDPGETQPSFNQYLEVHRRLREVGNRGRRRKVHPFVEGHTRSCRFPVEILVSSWWSKSKVLLS